MKETDKTLTTLSDNKPTVIKAKVLGYCMGVRRAVDMANRALSEYPNRRVWTLGPLIHNARALESLSSKGVKILETCQIDKLNENDVVIIRAHGVPPEIFSKLKATGCTLIDATCPRVMLSQRRAADFAAKGFTVIIAGDKNHGEVAGIAGCAVDVATGEKRYLLIENTSDAESLVMSAKTNTEHSLPQDAVLLCQTTISRCEYDSIGEFLKQEIKNLQILDTICPATMERQEALAQLQGQVEGVLIVGGKNSANTQRLLMTARQLFNQAALIESATEIPQNFLKLRRVGIAAGASTPDEVILEVEAALRS
ncbi:MAG: 4-hydroxy-3-methylbut-2-enyl diphosphate reductase [Spirochaetaceae bacterium]|nr:4-hydroxy-3-methylbut-2-enyl diphosphate reductase [Spirochaetaceae bacterium]